MSRHHRALGWVVRGLGTAVLAAFLVVVVGTGYSVPAAAQQVPEHVPGQICFTPQFWCWADPPGAPGQACFCLTPNGPVRGTLG